MATTETDRTAPLIGSSPTGEPQSRRGGDPAPPRERRPARGERRPGRPPASGPDRLSVLLVTVAGFLAVLAVLATQLRAGAPPAAKPVVVVRRVYETRVVETIKGPGGAGGTSVSQSVSSSGSGVASSAPTTRSS